MKAFEYARALIFCVGSCITMGLFLIYIRTVA